MWVKRLDSHRYISVPVGRTYHLSGFMFVWLWIWSTYTFNTVKITHVNSIKIPCKIGQTQRRVAANTHLKTNYYYWTHRNSFRKMNVNWQFKYSKSNFHGNSDFKIGSNFAWIHFILLKKIMLFLQIHHLFFVCWIIIWLKITDLFLGTDFNKMFSSSFIFIFRFSIHHYSRSYWE